MYCPFIRNRYPGTKPSDLTRYPDKPYQIDWIRYYLECKAEENGGSPTDVTERDVEEFYVKVNKFALVSGVEQMHDRETKSVGPIICVYVMR